MPTVEDRVSSLVSRWASPPASMVLFGSAARRDGGDDSDIDLLLVRPDGIDVDDQTWAEQRHDLARSVERWTSNRAQVVELSSSELAKARRRKEPLMGELQADGVVLAGQDPRA